MVGLNRKTQTIERIFIAGEAIFIRQYKNRNTSMGVQTMFWAISLCQTSGPDRHLAGNECFVAKILMMGKDFRPVGQ
ncbi:MAG: hypothetical protein BGO55_25105 [Sphingobacteriales bacterium 50-39]|nr:MAG: hypothetical protein BGO55_25105 [Sphingobacteriales bacterium 50-39]